MSEPMRIYVAGPMRGYDDDNIPAFNAAAARLRAEGFLVRNPVEIGLEAFGNNRMTGPQYVREDVKALCDCDAIALLPGWEASTGARCEVVVALTLDLIFYDAETGEERDPPNRVVVLGGYELAAGATS